MRTTLTAAVLTATTLTAWLCCMAGEPRTYDIPRLEGVSVDGDPADWKGGGFEVRQLLEVNGAVIAPEDLTASFRLGWDNHGLLVFVRVADDVFTEAAEEDELYRKDSVELYVSSAWGVKNTIQSVIAPGMTPDHSDPRWHIHEGRSEELAGVEVDLAAARRKVEGGYEIEVRIPLSSLGVDPVVGQEMGFQLYVNDADAPAGTYAETYHAVWFPRYGALNDPTAMYRIRFAESASLPVRAAARIADLRPEGVTLRTVGEAELMDHPAVIVGGDDVVATGMFAKVAGLAKAELLIPADMTTGQRDLAGLEIHSGGERMATIDQAILPPPAPTEHQALFGARIPRTMSLLANSHRDRREPVFVLLYGQSIVGGTWSRLFERQLRERFPYADLRFENRAIGGFGADRLQDTAEHDLYPAYPDLVVFHVYGGIDTGELERIFRALRERTTAELVVFNHHPNRKQHLGEYRGPSRYWRHLAQKYNCELVDLEAEWGRYILDNGLTVQDLLSDDVHPNDAGQRLLAALVGRHFRLNPVAPAGWHDSVRTYLATRPLQTPHWDEVTFTGVPWELGAYIARGRTRNTGAAVGRSPDSALVLPFVGNRVDVTAGLFRGPCGTARVLIDGKPPSENPCLRVHGRIGKAPDAWWPAIRRVDRQAPLIPETWAVEITEIDETCDNFTFSVTGTETGFDGLGQSTNRFVSSSGRVVIEPDMWMLGATFRILGGRAQKGFRITWDVDEQGTDSYAPNCPPDTGKNLPEPWQGKVVRTTLAQGLSNGPHTLELIPNGDGPVPVAEVLVHNPPLR